MSLIENRALAILQVLFSLQNLAEPGITDRVCMAFGGICWHSYSAATCKKLAKKLVTGILNENTPTYRPECRPAGSGRATKIIWNFEPYSESATRLIRSAKSRFYPSYERFIEFKFVLAKKNLLITSRSYLTSIL